jgi:malate dehydrogenase (oxaloacetate-decarboxylating)(NADP+)
LLNDPARNKGTAFTLDERREFRLEGLLPDSMDNFDQQLERVTRHLNSRPTDLEHYIYLIDLLNRNETLFYRAVMSDPARFMPTVYDPTVADACLAFGHIYRRTRGMYGMYITRDWLRHQVGVRSRRRSRQDGQALCCHQRIAESGHGER